MPVQALFPRAFSAASRRTIALAAALALAMPPQAFADELTGATYAVGADTASTITGTETTNDTIFGDPVSLAGQPVGLSSKLLSVGKNADGTPKAGSESSSIVATAQKFSADGTKVLTCIAANFLPPAAAHCYSDIDLDTGEITHISSVGFAVVGLGRSRDGKLLTVVDYSGAFPQLLVVDAATGQSFTVSKNPVTGALSDGSYLFKPAFSPDGRYLLFVSDATNLVDGDTNIATDVFLVDLTDLPNAYKSMVIVSTSFNGGNVNGPSEEASFTSDGTGIVFTSKASNIGGQDDMTADKDVFLKTPNWNATASDRFVKGFVRLLSSDKDGKGIGAGLDNCDSSEPAISPDGTRVAFTSSCEKLDPTDDALFSQKDVFVKWIADEAGGPPMARSCWRRSPTRAYRASPPAASPPFRRTASCSPSSPTRQQS